MLSGHSGDGKTSPFLHRAEASSLSTTHPPQHVTSTSLANDYEQIVMLYYISSLYLSFDRQRPASVG